jgi:hypothetical protein
MGFANKFRVGETRHGAADRARKLAHRYLNRDLAPPEFGAPPPELPLPST